MTGQGLGATAPPSAEIGGYTLDLLTMLPYPPHAQPTTPGVYTSTLVVR